MNTHPQISPSSFSTSWQPLQAQLYIICTHVVSGYTAIEDSHDIKT